jgi:hypothetical protein
MSDDDTNRLINHCLSFAKNMVESRGEFFPFAATIAPGGKISQLQPGFFTDESPETWREALEGLARASIIKDGACAAVLCFNGRVWPQGKSTPQSAILMDVEDSGGESFQVAQTYKKKAIFKGYAYGERMFTQLERKLFS